MSCDSNVDDALSDLLIIVDSTPECLVINNHKTTKMKNALNILGNLIHLTQAEKDLQWKYLIEIIQAKITTYKLSFPQIQ